MSATVTVPVRLQCAVLAAGSRLRARLAGYGKAGYGKAGRSEAGQASAEYGLVLLGAAAIAMLVTSWAEQTNPVGRLLGKVMDQIVAKVR